MNRDDIIYISLLLASIVFGYFWQLIAGQQCRKLIGTTVGVLIVVFVSGFSSVHPFFLTLFNACIIKYCSRDYCHIVSFFASFSYLFFFRLCHYFYLPLAPAHTNAIQMIMTLKMVGLCFEIHDTWKMRGKMKKTEDEEEKARIQLELKYQSVEPSLLDVFHYSFFYVGVLAGPFYKYRTYEDLMKSSSDIAKFCIKSALWRLRVIPLYAVLFLISAHYFPLSFAASDEIFRDCSFLYRLWYMTPIFFNFRMRIYTGFVLAECACMMAGLGAYPSSSEPKPGKGPTKYDKLESLKDGDLNFETIHNIYEWGAEFAPSVRGGMRAWNMTVQYWLAANVYKRLTLSKPAKEAITMFMSAVWHGVYAGYYLSLLTVPFILIVEDYYDRLIRKKCRSTGQKIYDVVLWFLKMQHFSYMGMAFLLLQIDTTLHYWRSIGFMHHGVIVFMHAFAQYVNLVLFKADKKLKKMKTAARIGDTTFTYIGLKEPSSLKQE